MFRESYRTGGELADTLENISPEKRKAAEEYAISKVGHEPSPDSPDYKYYWDRYFDHMYNFLFDETDEDDEDEEDEEDPFYNDINIYEDDEYEDEEDEEDNFAASLEKLFRAMSRNRDKNEVIGSNFFRYAEDRKEVFEFSKSIAEYIKENKIKDLVIIDRSSRPLYVGFMEYWKKVYPQEPMPKIFFVNPKGFKDKDTMDAEALIDVDMEAYRKDDITESIGSARSEKEILAEFEKAYPKLMADKNEPILVFDTCIHSGDSLYPVTQALKKLGFKDTKIGAVNPSPKEAKVSTDFFITKQDPEMGCYPYDRDRLIEKTFEHVYSKRTDDDEKRNMGIELRKEIKKIMEENLGNEKAE